MKLNHWQVIAICILGFSLGYFTGLEYPINTLEPYHPHHISIEASQANANIVAVSQRTGKGNIGSVNVRMVPGNGKTLTDTNPFIEASTQLSASTAKNVAERLVGMRIVKHDIIYSFDITGTVIGGPSAGVSMAVATAAAMKNRSIRDDVVATGSINYDGSIGEVGSIVEKAKAAGEAEMDLFLVPEGQGTFIRYKEEVEREEVAPGFIVRRRNYIPEKMDLNNYTQENYDMRTEEIRNVREALNYMLEG